MISDQLDQLAYLRAAVDALEATRRAALDQLLTDEIRQRMAEINQEYDARVLEAKGRAQALEIDIKAAVVKTRETVRGQFLMCVFSKGAPAWNHDMLIGYSASHPEINVFCTPGTPSASIRSLK